MDPSEIPPGAMKMGDENGDMVLDENGEPVLLDANRLMDVGGDDPFFGRYGEPRCI